MLIGQLTFYILGEPYENSFQIIKLISVVLFGQVGKILSDDLLICCQQSYFCDQFWVKFKLIGMQIMHRITSLLCFIIHNYPIVSAASLLFQNRMFFFFLEKINPLFDFLQQKYH